MLFLVLHIRKPSAVPFLKVDDEDEGYHCIDQAGEWMFLFRLWSIMFVAKAVGQAIINTHTHIATVAQQLFRVPVDDAYWYIQQLLSEYFEIQAPKMWLQGGSFGPNGWCWTKKAKLRLFGGLKDVHIGPWWFKMLMMIATFTVNSTCYCLKCFPSRTSRNGAAAPIIARWRGHKRRTLGRW